MDAPVAGDLPQRKVPVGGHGIALEERGEEDGDGVGGVEGVEGVDGPAGARLVAAEAEEEEEDGGLDEGEDGVVEHLDEEVPPEAGSGIVRGDVDCPPAEVVELCDC